jgi:putative phosphoserine phosphatase/1-acylglycerol-3-phosphate O-acyltransferase
MENISSKNKSSDSVAFFDLDQTIISVNSARTLIKTAYKKGLMSSKVLLKGYYFSLLYKLHLRDPAIIINSMSGWLKGASEDGLASLAKEIFEEQIVNFIHKEVAAEISFHRENGNRIVILSSSIYPICRLVADHLGMDDIICSKLEVKDGVYTGKSDGPFCFGIEKAVRLEKYCNDNNIDPSSSWYYGDAFSDIFVLSAVGNPVCINPDKRLRKAAIERGWNILNWH